MTTQNDEYQINVSHKEQYNESQGSQNQWVLACVMSTGTTYSCQNALRTKFAGFQTIEYQGTTVCWMNLLFDANIPKI